VVGRHVQLKKAGINHKGLCPFHGEKSPSFIVSPTRQTYHCFGCGVHGNAVGFLIEHSGMGFVDAVRDLAQQVGMTVPEDDSSPQERERAAALKQRQATLSDVLAKAGEHYRQQLKASSRAIDYLKGRGLSGEIAARFGLGYASDGWRGLASVFPRYDDPLLEESGLVISQGSEGDDDTERKRYDRFRDRIMFPIRSVQGEVIGFGGRVLDKGEPKYLNSPETPVFSKGRELSGLFEAPAALRQPGFVLVVEGYLDGVALAEAEGRARMLANAKPLWSAVPDGALKRKVIAQLATLGGLDVADLHSLWDSAAPPRPARDAAPRRVAQRAAGRVSRGTANLLDRALWLLIQRSDLWSTLDGESHDILAGQAAPYDLFFGCLERSVSEHGPLAPAALLGELRAQAERDTGGAVISRIAEFHYPDPASDPARELEHVL